LPAGRAGCLFDIRVGDGGLAVLIAADVQAVEPGRPVAVQDGVDADLVVHRELDSESPLR
jgi:hypothetical protein